MASLVAIFAAVFIALNLMLNALIIHPIRERMSTSLERSRPRRLNSSRARFVAPDFARWSTARCEPLVVGMLGQAFEGNVIGKQEIAAFLLLTHAVKPRFRAGHPVMLCRVR